MSAFERCLVTTISLAVLLGVSVAPAVPKILAAVGEMAADDPLTFGLIVVVLGMGVAVRVSHEHWKEGRL